MLEANTRLIIPEIFNVIAVRVIRSIFIITCVASLKKAFNLIILHMINRAVLSSYLVLILAIIFILNI